jgi:hypothetical protein
MSISPFSVRPASPATERRRARLVLIIATIGIVATLLAYAISPGIRHAVRHAAHSVKGAVSKVLDPDKHRLAHPKRLHLVQPLHKGHREGLRSHASYRRVGEAARPSTPAGVAAPPGGG